MSVILKKNRYFLDHQSQKMNIYPLVTNLLQALEAQEASEPQQAQDAEVQQLPQHPHHVQLLHRKFFFTSYLKENLSYC